MLSAFVACLTAELEKRGYGDKRQAELVDRFEGLRAGYAKQGAADPETAAMTRVLEEIDAATRLKNRLAYDALLKLGEMKTHIDGFNYNTAIAGATNEKATAANAIVALLSPDQRAVNRGHNIQAYAGTYKSQLWGMMNDVLDQMGKGMFGLQKGVAYADNVAREIFGQVTGDAMAAQLAKSWIKGTDHLVDMWNAAGGAMQRLDGWGLPQRQSLSKLIKAGGRDGADWMRDMTGWLNWDKMRWPNGAPIEAADRLRALEAAWETLSSDGMNKLAEGSFKGQGRAIGNAIDQHRFLVFKDGDAWLAMHEKYGDGNVFDVMADYIDNMTHKMGMVRVFGSNIEYGMQTARALALKQAAADGGAAEVARAKGSLNHFDKLAEAALRRNAMDPESVLAAAVNGSSNVLNSAFLAGSVLAAVPGDFGTTMMVRAAHHMPVLDGLIGPYVKGLLSPREASRLSAEAGFIMDGVVHTLYSHSRFSGVAEFGPAWTKRLSDFTMRASGMNVHTDVLRWVNYQHWMGMFNADGEKAFADLAWRPVAEKYGIDAAMWDKLRAMARYEPRAGVEFIRPSDILSGTVGTTKADRQAIYHAFQSMMLQEGQNMVIQTSAEANVILKGNLRPDTLPGALLHSFAMYKNFPIGLALSYGRAAMAIPDRGGRLAFTAGMGTSLVLAGAVGVQLRELSKGRDTLPMDTPAFWGKALMASGAMSLWGDFLFQGVNKPGGPADVVAGPLPGFVGDTMQLALGDVFDWADKVGTLKAERAAKTPWAAKAVEYASRYTPGSSLWYAREALQREIWDPLRMLADPRGASKMMHKEQQRTKNFGNESFWPPNTEGFFQSAPERMPQITGITNDGR